MKRTLFRTLDTLYTKRDRKEFENFFVSQAKEAGLIVLGHDINHVWMVGYKEQFLNYYIRTLKVSVEHGAKLSRELKRIISVLFWN